MATKCTYVLYLRPDRYSGSAQTATRVRSNRKEEHNSAKSQKRRQTIGNLVRLRKVMRASHRQGDGVGRGVVRRRLRKHTVDSEFCECRRTHTRLEYSLGKHLKELREFIQNGLVSDFPPLHDDSVTSVHQIIIQNRPADPGTIIHAGHQLTGCTRRHTPR